MDTHRSIRGVAAAWCILLAGLVVAEQERGPRYRLRSGSESLKFRLYYDRERRLYRFAGPFAARYFRAIAADEARTPGSGGREAEFLAQSLWPPEFGGPLAEAEAASPWGPRAVLECGSGTSSVFDGTTLTWCRFRLVDHGVRVLRLRVTLPGSLERSVASFRWRRRMNRSIGLLPAGLQDPAWDLARALDGASTPAPCVSAQEAQLAPEAMRAVLRVIERLESGRPPLDPNLAAEAGPWTVDWGFVRLEETGRPPWEHVDPDRRDVPGTGDPRLTTSCEHLVELAIARAAFEDCVPSAEEREWVRERLLGRSDVQWIEEARAALASALDLDR